MNVNVLSWTGGVKLSTQVTFERHASSAMQRRALLLEGMVQCRYQEVWVGGTSLGTGHLLSAASPLEKSGRERKPGAINISSRLCLSIPLDNLWLLTWTQYLMLGPKQGGLLLFGCCHWSPEASDLCIDCLYHLGIFSALHLTLLGFKGWALLVPWSGQRWSFLFQTHLSMQCKCNYVLRASSVSVALLILPVSHSSRAIVMVEVWCFCVMPRSNPFPNSCVL